MQTIHKGENYLLQTQRSESYTIICNTTGAKTELTNVKPFIDDVMETFLHHSNLDYQLDVLCQKYARG